MPTANDDATETEAAPPVEAASTSDVDEEDLPPPALIVRLREPDRPASRTIGAPAPEHVGPGASVTFGLSVAGRRIGLELVERMIEQGDVEATSLGQERGSDPNIEH